MKHVTGNIKQKRLLHDSCFMIHAPGFSLIEVILVIALFSIASIILVDMFIGQHRLYYTQTAELNINSYTRMALDDIDAHIRSANQVLYTYDVYVTSPQVLILQIQSINNSNQLIPGVYDKVVYHLSGSDLFRETFPDPQSIRISGTKRVAGSVNGLVFTYNNSDYLFVTEILTDITIQESGGFQNRTITASSKSRLRNFIGN